MGALLRGALNSDDSKSSKIKVVAVEVDSSPLWSGIANINSREVVIDAHQVKFRKRTHYEKFTNVS